MVIHVLISPFVNNKTSDKIIIILTDVPAKWWYKLEIIVNRSFRLNYNCISGILGEHSQIPL